jgi:hypothetical protein
MRTLLVVLVLTSTTIASADPQPLTRKNPNTALWLSLGTTAAGLGLTLVAADIGIRPQAYEGMRGAETPLAVTGGIALLGGPSVGRAYGHASLWNRGTALRVAGIGLFGAGFLVGYLATRNSTSDSPDPWPLIGIGAVVGGGLYIAGSAYEIATTPREVGRYNLEHGLDASLTMTALKTRDGIAPCLALAGHF